MVRVSTGSLLVIWMLALSARHGRGSKTIRSLPQRPDLSGRHARNAGLWPTTPEMLRSWVGRFRVERAMVAWWG
jgi:hypothetical protein